MENPHTCDYCSLRPTTHVLWYLKNDYLYGKTGCKDCVDKLAREQTDTDNMTVNKVYDEVGDYKVSLASMESLVISPTPSIWH